jgi:hypothetical protein
MPTSKPHYMMDCYFRDVTKVDGVRCDSTLMIAARDEEAISESKKYVPSEKLIWFRVRRESKRGSQVIYNSDP